MLSTVYNRLMIHCSRHRIRKAIFTFLRCLSRLFKMAVRLNLRLGSQMYKANSYFIFKRVKNLVEFPFLYSLLLFGQIKELYILKYTIPWTNLSAMRSCLVTSLNGGTIPQMLNVRIFLR